MKFTSSPLSLSLSLSLFGLLPLALTAPSSPPPPSSTFLTPRASNPNNLGAIALPRDTSASPQTLTTTVTLLLTEALSSSLTTTRTLTVGAVVGFNKILEAAEIQSVQDEDGNPITANVNCDASRDFSSESAGTFSTGQKVDFRARNGGKGVLVTRLSCDFA